MTGRNMQHIMGQGAVQKSATRMDSIPFSTIRTMFERVSHLEQSGQSVIHLDVGRPEFDTPEHIKQASVKALRDGQVHYTSNYGLPQLREAIAKKLMLDNLLEFDPDNEVIVTAGVSEAIMISMLSLVNPGDEVLILDPQFPAYAMATRMAGGIPMSVPVYANNAYQPVKADLQACLSHRTRMLVIASPGNPTGVVLSETTLRMLADFAISHDLLVMSDEIYEKLIYDNQQHISIASLPGMRSRTLTLNGFSKSYSMTGWRLGYVAADASLIQALVRIHQNTVVCANTFAQWGAVVALTGTQQPLLDMVNELDRRRLFMIEQLAKISGVAFQRPQGAMYIYVDVSVLTDNAYQLANDLLNDKHIAVVPWDQHHIRLAYGSNYKNLKVALTRLGEFLLKETV
ncbi:MAG: pyridoxal phosphate-dependent aminotransferase [Pseudomonadales bacterium]|nr:pyridoxal phosphate-dependent aminotransferase [Pseudomonadales bacterium]